jgi:hypothetical protein
MNAKLKAIKLLNLQAVVDDITININDTFGGITASNTSRIAINNYAVKALVAAGFGAKLVSGKAAFGVNKGKHGVIHYGFSKIEDKTHHVAESSINNFHGHAWIDIKNLDVIVDFTLLSMKSGMLLDNAKSGIVDSDYKLSNKVIVSKSENKTFARLYDNYEIGYHYSRNERGTELVLEAIEWIDSFDDFSDYLVQARLVHNSK